MSSKLQLEESIVANGIGSVTAQTKALWLTSITVEKAMRSFKITTRMYLHSYGDQLHISGTRNMRASRKAQYQEIARNLTGTVTLPLVWHRLVLVPELPRFP